MKATEKKTLYLLTWVPNPISVIEKVPKTSVPKGLKVSTKREEGSSKIEQQKLYEYASQNEWRGQIAGPIVTPWGEKVRMVQICFTRKQLEDYYTETNHGILCGPCPTIGECMFFSDENLTLIPSKRALDLIYNTSSICRKQGKDGLVFEDTDEKNTDPDTVWQYVWAIDE